MTESTALATIPKGQFAITQYNEASLREIVSTNLGGDPSQARIREFDLAKARVPSGGTTSFVVTEGTEEKTVAEIVGVVVVHQSRRNFWYKGIGEEGGGDSPPDCWSPDAITGYGSEASKPDVLGRCAQCPMSKFGSAVKDGKPQKGQRCAEKKALFILEKEAILPTVLLIPPTSLVAWKKYMISLIGKRVPVTGVVTKITLVKEKNAGGTPYAECRFAFMGTLDEADAQTMTKFASMFGVMFKPEPPTSASDEHAADLTVEGKPATS